MRGSLMRGAVLVALPVLLVSACGNGPASTPAATKSADVSVCPSTSSKDAWWWAARTDSSARFSRVIRLNSTIALGGQPGRVDAIAENPTGHRDRGAALSLAVTGPTSIPGFHGKVQIRYGNRWCTLGTKSAEEAEDSMVLSDPLPLDLAPHEHRTLHLRLTDKPSNASLDPSYETEVGYTVKINLLGTGVSTGTGSDTGPDPGTSKVHFGVRH